MSGDTPQLNPSALTIAQVAQVLTAAGGRPVTVAIIETDIAEPLRGFDLTSIGANTEDLHPAADFSLAVGLSLKGWGASTVALVKSDAGLESILEGAP